MISLQKCLEKGILEDLRGGIEAIIPRSESSLRISYILSIAYHVEKIYTNFGGEQTCRHQVRCNFTPKMLEKDTFDDLGHGMDVTLRCFLK